MGSEMAANDRLEIRNHRVKSFNRFMYEIDGLINDNTACAFRINLDADFGKRLEYLPAEKKQERFSEFVTDSLVDHDLTSVRFSNGGFLLTNITVSWDATGLDLTNTREFYVYDTHNVDTPSEAIDILTVFTKWVDLAHLLLVDDEYETNDPKNTDSDPNG